MAEWRNMAAGAAGGSFTYINETTAIAGSIIVARLQYGLAAVDCRGFGPGVHPPPNAGQGASAGGHRIDLAIDRIKRFSRLHAVLGNVFSLCVPRIGLQGNALGRWNSWQLHRAGAARHAETALRRLLSAKSHGHAALSVFQDMLRPPSPQAVTHAWAPAAEQLLRRAIDDLAVAEAAVGQMRPAIVAQYADARMLLHGG
uniref:BTR2-like-2 protein n=1 Tax=Triticum monococcum subsp. aegilopoides TaxID=52163 RepID=A0A7U3W891_TRIMO|nr:BTR2-like-2 protein [Triticum monococcum subsp. aegilopoides]